MSGTKRSGNAGDGLPASLPLAIGLMSGTSLDGIDAAILDCSNDIQVLAHAAIELDPGLRRDLTDLATPDFEFAPNVDPIELLGRARRDLTIHYGRAVGLLPGTLVSDCSVIGAHGQTIRHRPQAGFSLQILDGALLANLTNLPVACDLRSADIAAGGQGAPLVPVFHGAAFGARSGASNQEPSAVVNIGGIANVSIIGSNGLVLAGFDTGPGNRLLDDWYQRHHNGRFDTDGNWAATGQVCKRLLAALMQDPFFSLPPPKSTGREDFNLANLDRWMANGHAESAPADIQATLAEVTARSIADAVIPFGARQVLVCGGGAYNKDLLTRLDRRLNERSNAVKSGTTRQFGIAPQQVESAAFAWLGMHRFTGTAVALSGSTGARHDVIAGALHLPPPTT